jgi:hypothetical protein
MFIHVKLVPCLLGPFLAFSVWYLKMLFLGMSCPTVKSPQSSMQIAIERSRSASRHGNVRSCFVLGQTRQSTEHIVHMMISCYICSCFVLGQSTEHIVPYANIGLYLFVLCLRNEY